MTTDRRPTSHMEKKSNGHISARGRPIHFMFGTSRVGFSGSADRMALFPVGPKFNRYVEENNARKVWSQSKVFLVLLKFHNSLRRSKPTH